MLCSSLSIKEGSVPFIVLSLAGDGKGQAAFKFL